MNGHTPVSCIREISPRHLFLLTLRGSGDLLPHVTKPCPLFAVSRWNTKRRNVPGSGETRPNLYTLQFTASPRRNGSLRCLLAVCGTSALPCPSIFKRLTSFFLVSICHFCVLHPVGLFVPLSLAA